MSAKHGSARKSSDGSMQAKPTRVAARAADPTEEHRWMAVPSADILPVLADLVTIGAQPEGGSGVLRTPTKPTGTRPRRKSSVRPGAILLPLVEESRSFELEAEDLRSAFTELKYHAVLPPGARSVSYFRLAAEVEVPAEAEGIAVMGTLASKDETLSLTKGLMDKYQSLPMVVVLLDPPPSTAEVAQALLDAQCAFHDALVDEVLLRPVGGEHAARVAAGMAVSKAVRRFRECAVVQQAVQDCNVKLAEQAAQEGVQYNRMFWSAVHRVFKGFPKVDTLIKARTIGPGSMIGPTLLEEQVGKGSFGLVFAATNQETLGQEAVKVFPKVDIQEVPEAASIWREMSVLQKLRHPNIIRLHSVAHTRHHICFVMEHGGQNVNRLIRAAGGRLPVPQIFGLCGPLADAVAFCHQAGVAHRDIKPENVTVTSHDKDSVGIAKLIDFGQACEVDAPRPAGPWGTMPLLAPEVMALGSSRHGSQEAPLDPRPGDVWAFGVMVLEMAYGLSRLNKMMDWPERVEAHPQRVQELCRLFGKDARAVFQKLAASQKAGAELIELFVGTFEVDMECRITAGEAAQLLTIAT